MSSSLENKLMHEIEHGATETAVVQAERGWSSAAGKIRRQRRIEFLCDGLAQTSRVLEVGCGTGLQTGELWKKFRDLVGIDISPDLVALAEQRAPGPTYVVMDAHAPQFPDSSFDAIVGVSILHHLEWQVAMDAYFRLLKPGGVLRFSEPNLLNPQIFLQKNIPILKRWAGDSPDEYAFTKWTAERCLRRSGFESIVVTPFEFLHPSTPLKLIPAVLRLEKIIAATPMNHIAGSLLISARKGL